MNSPLISRLLKIGAYVSFAVAIISAIGLFVGNDTYAYENAAQRGGALLAPIIFGLVGIILFWVSKMKQKKIEVSNYNIITSRDENNNGL